MSGATEALQQAATSALRTVPGIGAVCEVAPLQAALPYAVVETGPATDWSHKNGDGREIRLAVTVRSGGERSDRVRSLGGDAEAAIGAIADVLPGWRIVTLRFLRSRTIREKANWASVIEFRARMLAE